MGERPALVVWDFDWSLVDANSDTWAIERLEGPGGPAWESGLAARDCGRVQGWTLLMDHCVAELWGAGFRREHFAEALRAVPLLPEVEKAARLAHERGVEQRILSDANEFYIEEILGAKGLGGGMFSRVVTNPGRFDGPGGRLRVAPHHPADAEPHGCPRCPTNLCKGAVLAGWLEELGQDVRVLYVGDGSGDYCPALRLGDGSVVAARSEPHDRLLRLCRDARDAGELRASVVEWTGADGGAAVFRAVSEFVGGGGESEPGRL